MANLHSVLILAGVYALSSWAAVSPKNSYTALPEFSVLTLKAESAEFPPRRSESALGTYLYDGDGDLVADHNDWCPNTPAGAPPWTIEDFQKKTVSFFQVGCAKQNDETIYQPKSSDSPVPHGRQVSCKLVTEASAADRSLLKSNALIVIDESLITLTEALHRTFDSYNGILLRTKGNTLFKLSCRAQHAYQTKTTSGGETQYYLKYFDAYEPSIEEISNLISVVIKAPPVPIP